jgi:hypothetical protein
MRSADASMLLQEARERDALCHVARVLVSDAAIQRAILANQELRTMLRLVDAGYPQPAAAQAPSVAAAEAAPPAEPRGGAGFGAELRAAASAAAAEVRGVAREAHAARLAAAAAVQRFLHGAMTRLSDLFASTAAAPPPPPPQRVVLALAPARGAFGDVANAPVRVTLSVVANESKVPRDGAAAAAAACADEDADGAAPFSALPQLLEAALVLAAAALAVLVLRRRGVPVGALRAALRTAARA